MMKIISFSSRNVLKEIIRNIIRLIFLMLFALLNSNAFSQKNSIPENLQFKLDSLDKIIEGLNANLPKLKESKDPRLYFTLREIDMAQFQKNYELMVFNEQLDALQSLIEDRLKRAQLKKDKHSIAFYNNYKDKIYAEIKKQRVRYRQLFEKEKNFKKEFNFHIKQENIEAYEKAKRITELAIKYANEQQLTETIKYLNKYYSYVNALIFDENSPYDLYRLTRTESFFMDKFIGMIGSDSLELIQEAENLVEHCYSYATNTKSLLDTNFFARQKIAVSTAIHDYIEKKGMQAELAKLTDKAIIVKTDSVNPVGVYKWHNYIVVIDTINPTSSFETVRQGEAILRADKVLSKYIYYNELGTIKKGNKLGHTFIIPFTINNKRQDFVYDIRNSALQFMVCYTQVVSKYFTEEISKYMPPMKFDFEDKDTDDKLTNSNQ